MEASHNNSNNNNKYYIILSHTSPPYRPTSGGLCSGVECSVWSGNGDTSCPCPCPCPRPCPWPALPCFPRSPESRNPRIQTLARQVALRWMITYSVEHLITGHTGLASVGSWGMWRGWEEGRIAACYVWGILHRERRQPFQYLRIDRIGTVQYCRYCSLEQGGHFVHSIGFWSSTISLPLHGLPTLRSTVK